MMLHGYGSPLRGWHVHEDKIHDAKCVWCEENHIKNFINIMFQIGLDSKTSPWTDFLLLFTTFHINYNLLLSVNVSVSKNNGVQVTRIITAPLFLYSGSVMKFPMYPISSPMGCPVHAPANKADDLLKMNIANCKTSCHKILP